MLKIEGLVKSYPGRDVLRGVTLAVPAGVTMALLGRSGAGKTTLTRCVTGLETYQAGAITSSGPVQLVWQDATTALSPFQSVCDSIREAGKRVEEMLALVGLTPERAARRPFQLSGGECQRAAIARALISRPRVLILDEPLASLDMPSQQALIPLLRSVIHSGEMATLLITHDIETMRLLADQVAFLDEGRIIETGTVASFLDGPSTEPARAFIQAGM